MSDHRLGNAAGDRGIGRRRQWLAGRLFSPEEIAARVGEVLAAPKKFDGMRAAARQTILERFALADLLPRHRLLIETLARGEAPDF
jgi:hypothetical protein